MLVLETGLGVPNANSYVTLDEADAYHSLYQHDDWTGTTAILEQALINATQSVDLLFGSQYLSERSLNSTGALLWPRLAFYDKNNVFITDTYIPVNLKSAVCEIALLSLNGVEIFPVDSTERNAHSIKIKIGDLETQTDYAHTQGVPESYPGFRKIDLLLYPILRSSNKPTRILR